MTDLQKIALANVVLSFFDSIKSDPEDVPVLVGTLTKAQGWNGFKLCDIGTPVFEFKGKFVIYRETLDGKQVISVPYNKETLTPVISFSKTL